MGPKSNTFLTPIYNLSHFLPPIYHLHLFYHLSCLQPCIQQNIFPTKYLSQEVSVLISNIMTILTLFAPCISESCVKIKIDLNFYFTLLRDPSKGCVKKGSVKKKE